MRNKLGFLWVAGVFALALVFGACDSGEYTWTDATEDSIESIKITLSSGKSWEATEIKNATVYDSSGGGGGGGPEIYTATYTNVSKGKYVKVDNEYYFYTEDDSVRTFADVKKGGAASTEAEIKAAIASSGDYSYQYGGYAKGDIAFVGVKAGKRLIIDGWRALSKAADGEYVEIEVIGEIED
ncbi:MAG: hypothetical protein Ta2G_18930 [Termitinemataceae bacterium]|nr:MAG: hypothetical protein Ta2G_18930 [Termitinemataceae bacterium]